MPQLCKPLIFRKYCERRGPYLACIAYIKGFCDNELVAITTDNVMFKQQARYAIRHRQLELWAWSGEQAATDSDYA